MDIGIISKSGIGDLIQNVSFLPSINYNIVGDKDWTFFIKYDENRKDIIERYLSILFHNSINVNIAYYDQSDEKNIIKKANDICDWVFAPMSETPTLSPPWLLPASFEKVKIMCKTNLNIKHMENKDIYGNTNIFCHFYSGSRGESRNIPLEYRKRIGELLINKYGQYSISFFSWDDPDVDKYEFNVIKNPDIAEIIVSYNGQLYLGVDSWIHSLVCGQSSWICWTESEWKMNTQRISNKLRISSNYRQIINSNKPDKILSTIYNIK
jgi:hypothetical protein